MNFKTKLSLPTLLTAFLGLVLSGCLLVDSGDRFPGDNAPVGYVELKLKLEQSQAVLAKASAGDTAFQLDSLIIVYTAADASPVRVAQPISGRPDSGVIALPPSIVELPGLRNWTARFYTIDERLSPPRRDTVHIDSVVFAVRPGDTSSVIKTVSPAFSILRTRFISWLADSVPHNVLWLRLRVDGVVRDSVALGSGSASLNWVQASTGLTIHAVGDSGKVLRSTNDGVSWSQYQAPGAPDMAAGFFPDANTGYVVARNGSFFKTGDGGASWDTRGQFTDSINALFMASTVDGFAVGHNGSIFKFLGDGNTKHPTITNTTQMLNGVHFPSAAIGFAVGENETILKTVNGTTDGWNVLWAPVAGGWFPQTSGTTNDIRGVHFLSKDTGWVVGAGDYVRVTYDGGASWQSRNISGMNANAVSFRNASTGWIVGNGGAVRRFVSEYNWGAVTSGTTHDVYDIRSVSADTAYMVGNNGMVRRSLNGSAQPWVISFDAMSIPVSSAPTWTAKTSNTTDNLNAVHFANANTGLAAGGNRTVALTTNGGESWSTVTAGATGADLNAAYAASTTTYFVAGTGNGNGNSNATALRRSTNSGANWGAVPIGVGGTVTINAMAGVSSTTAWIVGTSNLLRSTGNLNAGTITWTDRNTGTGTYNAVNVTSGNVWVVGNNAQVRRAWGTSDNASFSVMNNANLGSTNLRGVYFLASNQAVGWVVGDGGFIAKTTNGTSGVNWVVQGTPVSEDLVDVKFVNADTGYVTGAAGTVLKTVNGGGVWSVSNTGSSADLKAIHVFNGNTVVAVGSGGAVLKTTVGGQQPGLTRPLRALHNVSSSIIFIAGDSGTIAKTSNGGASWSLLTSGTTTHLYGIDFANANVGWAVGNGGLILKTANGGTSWQTQTSNTSQNLRSVTVVSADTAYATGANGLLLKTVNGGATWYQQEAPAGTGQLNRIFFLNAGTGFAVGNSGTILKAVNQGDNWTGGGVKRSLKGVYFASTTTGWIVGEDGIILKTTDGGDTWSEQHRQDGLMLYGVHFQSATTGWVTGENGTILKTTNGGTTWTPQVSNTTTTLKSVSFRNTNTGFVVGGTQSLLTTTNGGTTWGSSFVGVSGAATFDQTLTFKYLRPGQAHSILMEAIDRESPLRGYQSSFSLTVGAGLDSTLVSPMTRCGYGGPNCTP
jgi:photosystem II stability/assembly factor-like uncharacterized protein